MCREVDMTVMCKARRQLVVLFFYLGGPGI